MNLTVKTLLLLGQEEENERRMDILFPYVCTELSPGLARQRDEGIRNGLVFLLSFLICFESITHILLSLPHFKVNLLSFYFTNN